MKKFLARIFSLDDERSIWVEEEDLGRDKAFYHENKRYFVKIPEKINKKITIRLRGFGKKRWTKRGDLYLHVWLNRGEDDRKCLWLSDLAARQGADKRLFTGEKVITMVIPPKCYNGLTIRLKGYGREPALGPGAPTLQNKRRGNLFVKLCVYPDCIHPYYGSFDALSIENMALEGWVYGRFDEVVQKIGWSPFTVEPVQAQVVADIFNEFGWRRIFKLLVDHLKLTNFDIRYATSGPDSIPGSCEKVRDVQNNQVVGSYYLVTINEKFLDNPFSIAAILAHELCHIFYAERIDPSSLSGGEVKTDARHLEMERTIDLLVFMFRIGEFQLRVARDRHLTLGYFNQEVFERMQHIVSRKLNLS